MATGDFQRLHTQAPFRWAVSCATQSGLDQSASSPAVWSQALWLDSPVNGQRFCEQCAQEDLKFWGYTYWRRLHNLPGLDWCLKHRVPLKRVRGVAPFEQGPFNAVNSEESEVEDAAEVYPDCPVALRYGEILVGLIELNTSMPYAIASGRIRGLMQVHGLRLTEARRAYAERPTFSKMAQSMADEEWLESGFRLTSQHRSRGYSFWVDSVDRITRSPALIALALALFFQTSDEALNYWIDTRCHSVFDVTETSPGRAC